MNVPYDSAHREKIIKRRENLASPLPTGIFGGALWRLESIPMEEVLHISFFLGALCIFFIGCYVNSSMIINLLIRPNLRTTLNNLCCAMLLTNLLFGASEFFLLSMKILGTEAISENYHCSAMTLTPQLYRIVSLYLLLGSLFLRSLFVKHAKYISVVSKSNKLVITDFGIPIWVAIVAFTVLNGLFIGLHPNFPIEFPNVRICRGIEPYRNETDKARQFQILLMFLIWFIIIASFVLSSHLRLHQYIAKFQRKNKVRQNVNTIQQTIAAAYIKLLTSLINNTLLHWQAANPKAISTKQIQFCEAVAMSLECVIVPAFWLWETKKNFPELISSRNTVFKNCGESHSISISSTDPFQIIGNSIQRPLSPRRPDIVKNFESHALSLITTSNPQNIEKNKTPIEKKSPPTKTKNFLYFGMPRVVTPLPEVYIDMY